MAEEKNAGTYVGVRYDTVTTFPLEKFLETYSVPNSLKAEDFHSTVIYSRKKVDIAPTEATVLSSQASFVGYDTWAAPDGKYALVMLLSAPELKRRHDEIMNSTEATYDFDDYIPHITLSYDVGMGFDASKLPPFIHNPIVIDKEYVEPLDLSWEQ